MWLVILYEPLPNFFSKALENFLVSVDLLLYGLKKAVKLSCDKPFSDFLNPKAVTLAG